MQSFVGVLSDSYQPVFRLLLILLSLGPACLHANDAETTPPGTEAKAEAVNGKTVIHIPADTDGEITRQIESRLPAYSPDCSADEEAINKYKRAVKSKISPAARALGYYQAQSILASQRQQDCWELKVTIETGPPVRVISQDIRLQGEGKDRTIFQELYSPYPYKPNAPLNHKLYTDYKNRLLKAAQQTGYLEAEFIKKSILVDPKKNTASVTLLFDTGKRFRYGRIEVEQKVLDDNYLQRFIVLKEGDFYSSDDMIRQQQLLQNSGYYSQVSVAADFDHARQQHIPVAIKLTERKRNSYKFSFGYATDTGVRSRASMERRWTGKSGHRLNIDIGLSEHINEIQTQLTVPKKDPEKNNLYYTASYKNEDNEDVLSESFRVGIVYTSLKAKDWKRTLSLSYLDDRTAVDGESSNRSRLTLGGVKFSKVKADNLIFPEDGWRLRVEGEGALKEVLSDASVFKLSAHAKRVAKVGKGRLIGRLDLGKTFGDTLDDLPKDLRFFAGGINSIRGFSHESLGEVNDEGKVIGGRNLLESSLEYELPIKEKWAIAAFIDAGNAFDDIKETRMEVGIGAGLRWRSPIGPVRMDLAAPRDDASDLHIHLSIGPDL